MELSIISVNWNAVPFLLECIASIYEGTEGVEFEVIVVDNASPTGGVDALKNQFAAIKIIKSSENLGFAKANNLGYRHSSGRYLLFLNPDTVLVGPAIKIMLAQMKSLADAGIMGCKLLNSDFTVQTESIQRFPRILNQLLDVEGLRLKWPNCPLWAIGPLFADGQKPVRVEVVPGACMLLKREVFEAAGLFSEEYFMYAEDIDLNYKVSRLGLRSYYTGEATIMHHGGESSRQQKLDQWATTMKFRAMLKFYRKTRGRSYAQTYRLTMGCAALVRLAVLLPMLPFGRVLIFGRTAVDALAKWKTILQCVARGNPNGSSEAELGHI